MIEDYFNSIIESLFISHAVSAFKVSRNEVSKEDGFIRIKCNLKNGDIPEFAEYVVIHNNKAITKTYSYHWQKACGSLIKRWDNVPHHKEVDSFPHHLHLAEDKVVRSTKATLKIVLNEIEQMIIVHNE